MPIEISHTVLDGAWAKQGYILSQVSANSMTGLRVT